MKRIFALLFLISCGFLYACQEDEAEPFDPRVAVSGDYRMESISGSTFPVTFNLQDAATIRVHFDPSLAPDEVRVELEDFAEQILEDLTNQQFNSNDILRAQIPNEEQIAKLSGNLIVLEDVEFVTTFTSSVNDNDVLVCELYLDGNIDGSAFSFDYTLRVIGLNISYNVVGSAQGSRIE